MQYINQLTRLMLMGLGLSMALPALAEGTTAGTPVENLVTLNYQVNGGDQPALTSLVTFEVDRKLDVLVATSDANWVTTTIGQPIPALGSGGVAPSLNFLVSNLSNAASDIVVGVVDHSGAAVQVTDFNALTVGATDFNSVSYIVAEDVNGNNQYDEGIDAVLTANGNGYYQFAGVLEDGTLDLMIVVEVDTGTNAVSGEYESFSLVAAAANGAVAIATDSSGNASPGSTAVAAEADTALEQVVFADFASGNSEDDGYNFLAFATTGADDADFDGQSSDTSGFLLAGVEVVVAKYAEVIYDPVSKNKYDNTGSLIAGVEPKAIPGAVIMYVIGVANQDNVFDADGLAIIDNVPVGPVLLGDGSSAVDDVYYPASVDVDYPNATSDTFLLPAQGGPSPLNLDQVNALDCFSVSASTAFAAGDPEVAVNLGTCASLSSAYVVYFVTVDAS